VKLVVGLGNPGPQYQRTRHNVGFMAVDRLARKHRISLSSRQFQSLSGSGEIALRETALMKPLTFMNLSGRAVKRMVSLLRLPPEEMIVVHDDLDLAFGRIRMKRLGSDGGHQGVRSIIECLGTRDFPRLKIGIGRPPTGLDSADYVLNSFDPSEQAGLDPVLDQAVEAIAVWLDGGVDGAMKFLSKPFLNPLSQRP
jgi:peptidyl-tRNA hydrolase, PTH1 family